MKAAESKYQELKDAADKEAAAEADRLIEAIGAVTLDSGKTIEAARAAYDALTNSQKVLVKNLETLTKAEATYGLLVKEQNDKKAAAEVDRLIEAVGDEITLDSREAIEAARAAYNALTDSQKALVKNLDSLIKAESVYDAITEKQETENQDVHEQKGEDSHTPKTGEDQSLTPWLLMILLGGSGISLIKRRKDTDLL